MSNEIFNPFRSLAKFRELHGDKFIACCPVHQEKTPSFHGTIKGTKLMVICRGCGATAKAVRGAMGLPWSAFFTDSRGLGKEDARKWRIAQREREKAEQERIRLERITMARYCAIADDLNDRDAILKLDWSAYAGAGYESGPGPEMWDLLGSLLHDYSRLEHEYETLRHPM